MGILIVLTGVFVCMMLIILLVILPILKEEKEADRELDLPPQTKEAVDLQASLISLLQRVPLKDWKWGTSFLYKDDLALHCELNGVHIELLKRHNCLEWKYYIRVGDIGREVVFTSEKNYITNVISLVNTLEFVTRERESRKEQKNILEKQIELLTNKE